MSFTVTKIAANRFLVEGAIAVIGGEVVNEAYSRLFATKAKAEADAAKWVAINVESLDYVAERRALRVFQVSAYLAARAARADAGQFAFNF